MDTDTKDQPPGETASDSPAQGGGDGEKKEVPKLDRAHSLTGVNLAHHLDVYKQRQAALQAQLASLSASLKQFDIRANEAKKEEEEVRRRAAAEAAKSWGNLKRIQRAKSEALPCHIAMLPNDLLHRVCARIPARSMFLACCVDKRFRDALLEREYWEGLIETELGDDPREDLVRTASKAGEGSITVRELKDFYRERTQKWENVMTTFDWLISKGCPSEVNGTKQGPWSRRNLTRVLEDLIMFSMPGSPQWRHQQVIPRVRCICSLLNSGVQGIQEMAACALANLLTSSEGGGKTLARHNGIKYLQGLLQSHSLGMQKQAARALINALIDDETRVLHPCLGELQHTPIRFCSAQGGEVPARVDWLCVDFTPSGSVGEPFGLTLEMKNGRLWGHGQDVLGRFTVQEATLNRSLQWASGASIDEFLGSDLSDLTGGFRVNPGPEAAERPAKVESEDVAAIKAVGHSTPKELPEVLARYGANLRAKKFRYSYGEMVERVAGYQARYNTARTTGIVEVHCGTEHMELLKTYETGHGDDHVRLIAFVDQAGMFGMWERGRYHHHHKMEGSSRGCFRMWQMR